MQSKWEESLKEVADYCKQTLGNNDQITDPHPDAKHLLLLPTQPAQTVHFETLPPGLSNTGPLTFPSIIQIASSYQLCPAWVVEG